MNVKEIRLFWLMALIIVGVFLFKISDILFPFIVSITVAYFLDPAADKLERLGLSRLNATLAIIGSFFLVCILIAVLLVPLLYEQFLLLSQKLPDYADSVRKHLLPSLLRFVQHLSPDAVPRIQEAIGNFSGTLFQYIGQFLGNILKSGLAILNILSLIFITPIITFYILRDWDLLIIKVDSWLPRKHVEVIREQMRQIDATLSGYIRGQTNVCLLMALFYGIGLSLAGLDFGLFIGFGTGVFSFIPYGGFLIGFIAGIGVAFFQFGLSVKMLVVIGVFMAGQVLESNFLTPKLVGDKVGLHPAWLVFGMLAGAALFGFLGVLLAVPVTAILGVLTRFFLHCYLQSSLYLNKAESDGVIK